MMFVLRATRSELINSLLCRIQISLGGRVAPLATEHFEIRAERLIKLMRSAAECIRRRSEDKLNDKQRNQNGAAPIKKVGES
jgi:hypothetical protein